jgi:ribosomal protein S18 acetylase RimI-like enzyme
MGHARQIRMSTQTIRPAVAADHAVLVAFNLAMAKETEDKHLDSAVLSEGVRRALADPARGRYFVCEQDSAVVGALMVTHEWSDWRNGDFWWIQSVYTTPAARGAGVYRALHEHVVRAAKAEGAVGVRLYVEPHNARAIATYTKLGMEKTYDVMETPFTKW